MKALATEKVPPGDWLLEIKFDGYRALTTLNGGQVELWSRNHLPLSASFPELVPALAALPCRNAVIDGEIVALDPQGRPRFQLLQGLARDSTRPPLFYYVFDLLHLDGTSLLGQPIESRKALLDKLFSGTASPLGLSPVFRTTPAQLLAQIRRQGLEGIVAKTARSLYEPGRRSGHWLKCRIASDQEFVVGGFTPPRGSRTWFGALLLGYYDHGQLHYAGKVGTGFNEAARRNLMKRFRSLQTTASPFVDLPQTRRPRFGAGMTAAAMREVTWLKPELVVQARFSEWTREGQLRHPVYLGLRDDKAARDVVRETGAA